MDGGDQNDPEDIPRLIKKLDEGHDVVSGLQNDHKDNFFLREIPSKTENQIISDITDFKLNVYGCSLKAYRNHVSNDVKLYG